MVSNERSAFTSRPAADDHVGDSPTKNVLIEFAFVACTPHLSYQVSFMSNPNLALRFMPVLQ